VFSRAKGSHLFDVGGRPYLDLFTGAGTMCFGHNPEPIRRRLIEYLLADGPIHGLDCYTVAKRDFLEEFDRVVLAPRRLPYRVQFCGPTGTDAVEAALKLARKVTGRSGAIAFTGSYHGASLGSLAVTGDRALRRTSGALLGGAHFVPYPTGPAGEFDTAGYLARLFDDDLSGVELPAALIIEPVQMEGGVYPAPAAALAALRALCDRHGIVLICDEIQSGYGRTGTFFAFERAGIVPDIVTLSKAVSGYGLPMSLVLIRRELDGWSPGESPGTFRGHQLAFVAARAALAWWRDGELGKAVEQREAQIRAWFARRAVPGVELRTAGLAVGVDVSAIDPELARTVADRAFAHGVLVECCGRRHGVLKIIPPLTIDAADLEAGLSVIADALELACAGPAPVRSARPAIR
jgi:diaminobutyrate-2-oxoglutarate transaminase